MDNEMRVKLERLRTFIESKGIDGVLLTRVDNFSWITGGKYSHVVQSSETGVATIAVTRSELHLITDRIEAPRIFDEEVSGADFECLCHDWFEDREAFIKKMISGRKFVSDTGIAETPNALREIRSLRASLTGEEVARAREAGRISAKVMNEACRSLKPGDSEYEIAAGMTCEMQRIGQQAPVVLIASDDRVFKYRHPLPKAKKVEKYALVVMCARINGLWISSSRCVHFGEPGEEIKKKFASCIAVDAAAIMSSKISAGFNDVFANIVKEYEAQNFKDEWKLHHQGGPMGYESRDFLASPYTKDKIVENQLIGWNPSIAGVKSEDTIIVRENGAEIITAIDGWPMTEVSYNGEKVLRPQILIR